jgi:hypothetical protein
MSNSSPGNNSSTAPTPQQSHTVSDPLSAYVSSHISTLFTDFQSSLVPFLNAALSKYQTRSQQTLSFYETQLLIESIPTPPGIDMLLLNSLCKERERSELLVEAVCEKVRKGKTLKMVFSHWKLWSAKSKEERLQSEQDGWRQGVEQKFKERVKELLEEKENALKELEQEQKEKDEVEARFKGFLSKGLELVGTTPQPPEQAKKPNQKMRYEQEEDEEPEPTPETKPTAQKKKPEINMPSKPVNPSTVHKPSPSQTSTRPAPFSSSTNVHSKARPAATTHTKP